MKYQLIVLKDNKIIFDRFYEDKVAFVDSGIFFENDNFKRVDRYTDNNFKITTYVYAK